MQPVDSPTGILMQGWALYQRLCARVITSEREFLLDRSIQLIA